MDVHDHIPLEELQHLAKAIAEKRVWGRYQAVILASQGRSAAGVASALGCSVRSVQVWVARYNRGGPEALGERPHTGRPPRLHGPDLARFRERLEAGPTPEDGICTFYGPDLRRILEREFGVLLGLQAVYDLLHRHGFSSLMPRPQHKDADEELQAIFKEVIVDQIQAIQEAHPDEDVQVWFEDEARFGQQGTLCRVWARTGSRPRGVRQTQYTYLYVLTEICVGTGAASGLITPVLNAGVVNLFLEQFSRELPAGVHAVLVWDGRATTPAGLVVPGNMSLIQLVAYSPELNPVENLWHYLRSHYWSLRVYRDYDALEEAAIAAWRAVCLEPGAVRSICAAPYVGHSATQISGNRITRHVGSCTRWSRVERLWEQAEAADRRVEVTQRQGQDSRVRRSRAAPGLEEDRGGFAQYERLRSGLEDRPWGAVVFRPEGPLNDRAWAEQQIALSGPCCRVASGPRYEASFRPEETLTFLDRLLTVSCAKRSPRLRCERSWCTCGGCVGSGPERTAGEPSWVRAMWRTWCNRWSARRWTRTGGSRTQAVRACCA